MKYLPLCILFSSFFSYPILSKASDDVLNSNSPPENQYRSRNDLVAPRERFQFPLAECLIGWTLLVIHTVWDFSLTTCTFICGAVVLEHTIVYKNLEIPGFRDFGLPTGSWLIAPIPTVVSVHDTNTAMNLVAASFGAFISLLFLYKPETLTATYFPLWLACSRIAGLAFTSNLFLTFIFIVSLSLGLSSYRSSLTIWECVLIAQICFVFHINTAFFILPLFCIYTIGRFKMAPSWETFATFFVSILWLWLLLSDFATQLINEDFYADPISPLHFDPTKFLTDLITLPNILLVTAVWIPLCFFAIAVVVYYSQSSKGAKTPAGLRKLFHLLAGVVYTTGLLVAPRLLSVCSLFALVVFLLFEWTRRRGPPTASNFLNEVLEPFRDSRDGGEIIFTPIALLLGLSLPVWNFCYPWSQNEAPPRAWSGVITIALGDSVAALVGRRWGHLSYRWPGTHRTLIGSVASFVSQMMMWFALAAFYCWPWRVGLLPLAVGVLAEAYTEQIDNLVIPLLVMSLLPS